MKEQGALSVLLALTPEQRDAIKSVLTAEAKQISVDLAESLRVGAERGDSATEAYARAVGIAATEGGIYRANTAITDTAEIQLRIENLITKQQEKN